MRVWIVCCFGSFLMLMNPLTALLATTDRRFVISCVIMSLLLGMIWYHQKVFWKQYGRWMKFPVDEDCEDAKNKPMLGALIGETISRILYFIWLWQALLITGWEHMSQGFILGFVVWIIFVFPTQLSQISRSPADKRVLWILWWKILVETFLAVVLRFLFFQ